MDFPQNWRRISQESVTDFPKVGGFAGWIFQSRWQIFPKSVANFPQNSVEAICHNRTVSGWYREPRSCSAQSFTQTWHKHKMEWQKLMEVVIGLTDGFVHARAVVVQCEMTRGKIVLDGKSKENLEYSSSLWCSYPFGMCVLVLN